MKKNIVLWFVPVLFSAFVLISCDNYLDVQPKGVQLLETIEDYDLWLNSRDLEIALPTELNLLADNIDDVNVSNPPKTITNRVYTWQSQFSDNLDISPVIWSEHYKSIYYFNTVLKGIDDAAGEDEGLRKNLKAEALLGRAYNYLYLVNIYGKAYSTTTADEDLAVPFVTSNDLNEPTPERSTVQDIYDHIISDIETAIPDLPADNSQNRFRGSVAAAYSILARTYLYMGDYDKAALNAQQALDNGQDGVLDYTAMANSMGIPDIQNRPGAIYARFNTSGSIFHYPQLAFLQSFNTTDLRLNFFYTKNGFPPGLGDYSFTTRGEIIYRSGGVSGFFGATAHPNWGTTVAEMRLILAEVAARANDLGTACDELDLVRKCRIPSASYVKFESTNQEEVLQKVLDERTFEFAYNGLRFFDMKRLDAEGRMPAVNRLDGEDNVMATLSPGSTKYTLQIPVQVLYFNPGWPQNPHD